MNLAKADVFPFAAAAIGLIDSDTFARASIGTSYSILASGVSPSVWACDGSKLQVSVGNSSAENRLRYNYDTSSEKNVQVVTAQLTSVPAAGTTGLAVGFSDNESPDGERTVYARLITNTTSADIGKIQIITYNGTTATVRNNLALQTALTVNQNDIFTWTATFNIIAGVRNFACTVTRAAGGSTSANFDEALTSGGVASEILMYSTAEPAIFHVGGNWDITLWSKTINDLKNPKALFIGASISHVFFATDFTTRWDALVGAEFTSFEVSAGSGDVTQRVLDKMTNILQMRPRIIFLEMASNDIGFGVATGTWQANYRSMVAQFKAAGIHVIHVYPFPANSYDVTPIMTFIDADYATHDQIAKSTFNSLNSGTGYDITYSADGAHPNQLGHSLAATDVIAELRL